MANLHTLDKLVYKQATRGLSYQQRQALLATQTLGLWDSSKQKEHYLEGDGLYPWCSLVPGGALHEAWQCDALKGIQQEVDPDLTHLTLENTPHHILPGIPSQLPADFNWDFFLPRGGLVLPEGLDGLLHFQGLLESEGFNLLQN